MQVRKPLSRQVKFVGAILLTLATGICVQQLAVYLIPPPRGEQCQLGSTSEAASASSQLVPAGKPASATSQPAALPAPLIGLVYARSGFGLASTADPVIWSARLGTGWYVDWDVQPISSRQAPAHWQMIRLKPGCIYPSNAYIRWVARRYPGNVWIIGNEPDVALQDDLTPEEYAQDYHELYRLIKQADHSALVAVAGVAQATPLRLEYLDRVLQYYQKTYNSPLPVDWWTLHGYVLPEQRGSWGVGIPPGLTEDSGMVYSVEDHGRLDLFKQQILAFRTWMAANGYSDTPLALTEFGILIPDSFGYSQYGISKYLTATVTWLNTAQDEKIGDAADEGHLVQKWAWFSLSDPDYPNSDLAVLSTGELTLVGQALRNFNLSAAK